MPSKVLRWLVLATAWTVPISAISAAELDWQESDVAPPPVLSERNLVPVAMPAHVTLRFGVAPDTLSIGKDGVIRYVMIATGAGGARNVMFEGIRCSSGEVKTYARHDSSGKWMAVAEPQWRPLQGGAPVAHALALARQGACSGHTIGANSVAALIKILRNLKPDPH